MTDTDKLNLILEHAGEYYKNKRLYHFVKDGFVSYELFKQDKQQALYINDIFVRKVARGGTPFKELIQFCLDMEHTHRVDLAYARTSKDNKYLINLDYMYTKIGFKKVYEDEKANYYKLVV